ncbi:5-formyltetrahydrofolate cyclo-ligase [Gaetbulibacter aestuarii]|uniref:5-formyltetrahydrofolate cyclo-ligase n=1 Tax=Gaetbulibacter aestuarii TaxID=1502358 RepID=A0ABW7MVM2_9FLAO
MTKAELRKKYKGLRALLSPQERDDMSLDIANQLLKLPIWNYSYYHIFLTIEELREIDTNYILNILAGKDKHIVVSKSDFESGKMTHFLLTDSTILKKNTFNIPEPVEGIQIPDSRLEVVFVPLLAFDMKGHRIGYGKGFYDKFLADCAPETVKIGLSFFEPEQEDIPVFESDIKLDYGVTPRGVYSI